MKIRQCNVVKKIIQLVIVGLAYILVLLPTLVSADNLAEPDKFLAGLTSNALKMVRDHADEIAKKPALSAQLVEPLLSPHIAFEVMSGYILGNKVWSGASEEQKQRFIAAFKELLVRTYSTTILAVIDGKIQYFPPKGELNKEKIQVASLVVLEGKTIKLTYRLVKQGNEWKIYDILVENISLIKGFSSQFADILKKTSNIDEVIKAMQERNGGQ